jgi:hypothetical protein
MEPFATVGFTTFYTHTIRLGAIDTCLIETTNRGHMKIDRFTSLIEGEGKQERERGCGMSKMTK